jgi:GxxExxY protein
MNAPQRHGDTEANDPNELTRAIIGAAIAVHRALGPGLLESIYEAALCVELDDCGIKYVRQSRAPAYYKGRMLGNHFVDLIVDDRVVVDVKSVAAVHPVMEAQLLSYMRLTKKRVGLLINFNSPVVADGITRRVL